MRHRHECCRESPKREDHDELLIAQSRPSVAMLRHRPLGGDRRADNNAVACWNALISSSLSGRSTCRSTYQHDRVRMRPNRAFGLDVPHSGRSRVVERPQGDPTLIGSGRAEGSSHTTSTAPCTR